MSCFSGDALGAQDNEAGLILRHPLATFARALAAWRAQTDGKYKNLVYTAHNDQWITLRPDSWTRCRPP